MPRIKSQDNRKTFRFTVNRGRILHYLLLGFKYILLTGLSFIILYPFIVKISSSLLSQQDLVDGTVHFVARNPTLDNFKNIIIQTKYFEALANTSLLSLISGVTQTLICTIIGYGFAKFDFKGKRLVFALVIFTLIIPPQALSVSYYMKFLEFDIWGLLKLLFGNTLRTVDSFFPIIILSLTGLGFKNGLYIFIMRQFFVGVPGELHEAAYVDGAGVLKTYYRIILPLAAPMMTTVFLFSFAWQWTDDYYAPLFFIDLNLLNKVIASAGTISFNGNPVVLGSRFSGILMNAGAVLVILPLIVFYLISQRKFVQGIESSGIVG